MTFTVVYKLSKRFKHDETLSQLHSILFNKRGKVRYCLDLNFKFENLINLKCSARGIDA